MSIPACKRKEEAMFIFGLIERVIFDVDSRRRFNSIPLLPVVAALQSHLRHK